MRLSSLRTLLLLTLLGTAVVPFALVGPATVHSSINAGLPKTAHFSAIDEGTAPSTSDQSTSEDNETVSVPLSPILLGVTNTTTIIERNESINQGAVLQATLNTTVTITYHVIGGNSTIDDEETNLMLYINDGNTYSFDTPVEATLVAFEDKKNITIDYLGENITFENVQYAVWNYTLLVNSSYIEFYAKWWTLEESFGYFVPNVITTGFYLYSQFNDSRFTQYEPVTGIASFHNAHVNDTFKYHITNKATGETTDYNITNTAGGTHADSFNLGTFEVGTNLTLRASGTFNDTVLNKTRTVYENAIHNVTIVDGDPLVAINLQKHYINYPEFTLNITSSVAKGSITNITFVVENVTTQSFINTSSIQLNITLPRDSEYLISAYVHAGPGYTEENTTLVLDRVAPTLILMNGLTTTEIRGLSHDLTLTFNASDDLAGVESVIVDFGDGSMKDVTFLSSYTHHYATAGTYTVLVRVTDRAGNMIQTQFTATFVDVTAPIGEGAAWKWVELALLAIILLALAILWSRRNK